MENWGKEPLKAIMAQSRGCVLRYHQQHNSTASSVGDRNARVQVCNQGAVKEFEGFLNISEIIHKTSFNIHSSIWGLEATAVFL